MLVLGFIKIAKNLITLSNMVKAKYVPMCSRKEMDLLLEDKLRDYIPCGKSFGQNTLVAIYMPELEKLYKTLNTYVVKSDTLARPVLPEQSNEQYRQEMNNYFQKKCKFQFSNLAVVSATLLESIANFLEGKKTL
jgi:hypothetical protein